MAVTREGIQWSKQVGHPLSGQPSFSSSQTHSHIVRLSSQGLVFLFVKHICDPVQEDVIWGRVSWRCTWCRWQSSCLTCTKPSPEPWHVVKPGMWYIFVGPAEAGGGCSRQKNQKLKAFLYYIVSSISAWDMINPVSKLACG